MPDGNSHHLATVRFHSQHAAEAVFIRTLRSRGPVAVEEIAWPFRTTQVPESGQRKSPVPMGAGLSVSLGLLANLRRRRLHLGLLAEVLGILVVPVVGLGRRSEQLVGCVVHLADLVSVEIPSLGVEYARHRVGGVVLRGRRAVVLESICLGGR